MRKEKNSTKTININKIEGYIASIEYCFITLLHYYNTLQPQNKNKIRKK